MPSSCLTEEIRLAAGRNVSRETTARLEAYVDLLIAESERQNLVSRTTLDSIWLRHVLDSAQLARFEPFEGASWADVGSGAGLPGIVLACIVAGPVTLIEPRALRVGFLQDVVTKLGLNATVAASKVERHVGIFDVITGRAVAPLTKFFEMSLHLSTTKTAWALPRGRNAQTELVDTKRAWQGVFHVERSVTDEDSQIVVGTGVRKR